MGSSYTPLLLSNLTGKSSDINDKNHPNRVTASSGVNPVFHCVIRDRTTYNKTKPHHINNPPATSRSKNQVKKMSLNKADQKLSARFPSEIVFDITYQPCCLFDQICNWKKLHIPLAYKTILPLYSKAVS